MVAAATGVLFLLSRGKWTDPIIDIGSEWLWPDALAKGDLLYRDVVYWFGPFTPYFHAAFFLLFGSSFATLALAGAAASLLTLAALYASLRLVTARAEALLWTALAIPLLVFMRFAGGGLLGMGYRMWHAAAFTLAAFSVAFAHRKRRWHPWVAGALIGMGALCRVDWGLFGFVAMVSGLARRGPSSRAALRAGFAAGAAGAAVFCGAMAPFLIAAGPSAFMTESFVFLVGLPAESRRSGLAWMGLDRWPWGVWSWVYSAAVWISGYWVVEIVALRRSDPRAGARRLRPLLGALGVLACGAWLGLRSGSLLLGWVPLVCGASVAAGIRRGQRGAALVAFGLVGLLGSVRRIFDLGDFGYVAPPLLFALVCAAGLIRASVHGRRRPEARRSLERGLRLALGAVLAGVFLMRGLQYSVDRRVAIPGTRGFLTASPARARELDALARAIRARTPTGSTLVVFPDAAMLNFLADRRNPLRNKLYVAGYLRSQNEDQILSELARQAPAAVVVLDRPDGQEPTRVFGADYGRKVRKWIEERYDLRPVSGAAADPAGFPALLGFPRSPLPMKSDPQSPGPGSL